MSLPEVEFELSAQQYALMDYPALRQGHALSLQLDGGVLLPEPGAQFWYAAQAEPLPPQFVHVGRATYAFTGQIVAADIAKGDGLESATLLVECGTVRMRVTCAPQEDGRLPYGVWETRTLTGLCHLQGVVDEDFASPIGESVGVTVWHFRRLLLTPGDPKFGEWHQFEELHPLPFTYDRLLITARAHRSIL
ncbi:MAG: hypothetical protein KDD78_18040 [Caldilineaceae bacterium]|nr:hypothetical protein [Caldilineaceae bacterium]